VASRVVAPDAWRLVCGDLSFGVLVLGLPSEALTFLALGLKLFVSVAYTSTNIPPWQDRAGVADGIDADLLGVLPFALLRVLRRFGRLVVSNAARGGRVGGARFRFYKLLREPPQGSPLLAKS
jgi:hypothetical protein